MPKKKRHLSLQHWHYVAGVLFVYDAMTICLSFFLAMYLRFDFQLQTMMSEFGHQLAVFLPIYTSLCLVVYYLLRLYHSIWRFASFVELERIAAAIAISAVLSVSVSLIFNCRLPGTVYLAGIVFQFLFACGMRFSYRFVLLMRNAAYPKHLNRRKAMIIGAGEAGQMLERDARKAGADGFDICCFIDDNPNKHGRLIDQIPVVGGRDEILNAVETYGIEYILFAVPSASPRQRRDILNICQESGCEIRVLPSLISLATGSGKNPQIVVNKLQNLKMEDLPGREPVSVDTDEILSSITGKIVLITGGGGSIGSELCRQIADHSPKQLILVDIYENNAYEIQNELIRVHPELNLKVLIASVRDAKRIEQIFSRYRPQIVYHAAAHKHVPLMETSPCESVKNNVFGTLNTSRAALKYGVERFVLISTDKAVNPTNIMGATKRLCEMIIQTMNDPDNPLVRLDPEFSRDSSAKPCQFVAVRFGNVLGSNGSVIPLFKKQIEHGGPVTVTHPDIIRYFMTIQEAVSLILEAGTYARGGEIFVLNMGEPVKIDDLARNMIRLAGKKPNVDIKIEYTGLRPGEKMFEEKLMDEEGLEQTRNSLIHIGRPLKFDIDSFASLVPFLYEMAMDNEEGDLVALVASIVETYDPDWDSFEKEGILNPKNRYVSDSAGSAKQVSAC